jgi:L,D-peptidoglycan transpeptidase YkuD (ErfK/YbiS/YcfS/YnhG family)
LRVILFAAALAALSCSSPPAFAGEELIAASSQHVLVVVESARDTTGWLYRYARDSGGWRVAGEPVQINVGSGGVGKTREGDKRAPSGAYPLTAAFGYDPAPPGALRMPYVALTPDTECVDDESSPYYNQVVNATKIEGGKTWKSSEMMRRDIYNKDELYKFGLLVAYNPTQGRDPDTGRGAGSCIFLHIWRGPGHPTVGCTSMSEENLLTLLAWLDPAAKPLLVQGSRAELEAMAKDGKFPYPLPAQKLT